MLLTAFPRVLPALLIPLLLCHCANNPPQRTPAASRPVPLPAAPADILYGTANVENVTVEIVSTSPMRAKVTVRGLLNDGATHIDKIEQTRITGGFVIKITTSRQRSSMATLALVPFEREIILDLSSNASGPCQVRVNDTHTVFNIP